MFEVLEKILFLENWTIRLKLVDEIVEEDGEEYSGTNEFQLISQACLISISTKQLDTVQKVCKECTLVHELLHCKYNWLSPPNSFEAKYYITMDHVLLEQMAKSLIMVKYGLPFDWFQNFSEEDK